MESSADRKLKRGLKVAGGFALIGAVAAILVTHYLATNYYPEHWNWCALQAIAEEQCKNGKPPWWIKHDAWTVLIVAGIAALIGWFLGLSIPVDD